MITRRCRATLLLFGTCCSKPGMIYVLGAGACRDHVHRAFAGRADARHPIALFVLDACGFDRGHRRRPWDRACLRRFSAWSLHLYATGEYRNLTDVDSLRSFAVGVVARRHFRGAWELASPGPASGFCRVRAMADEQHACCAGSRGSCPVDPRHRSGRHGGDRHPRDDAVVQRRRRRACSAIIPMR